jgi:hypothetical protein
MIPENLKTSLDAARVPTCSEKVVNEGTESSIHLVFSVDCISE